MLAIDFGGTKIDLATAGPDGRLTRRRRIDTLAPLGARQAVDRAIAAGLDLLAGDAARGVGAVFPGVVSGGRVRFAPNLPGLDDLDLPRILGAGFDGSDVVCANDVKAAGAAEARWGALRDADPGLFVSLGTGVAAALVVDGRVLAGANGAAGEFGYNLRGTAGSAGAATGHAPLEELAGGASLVRRGTALLGRPVTAAELFASADPRAVRLVDGALDELAVHVANLATALDPARIAVGGGLMASADRVLAALGRRLRQAVPFPPDLVAARFVQDSALRGSLALVLDRLGV